MTYKIVEVFMNKAIQDVLYILQLWQCTDHEVHSILGVKQDVLILMSRSNATKLDCELELKINYILNIDKSLKTFFSNEESIHNWVRKNNTHPLFGGKPAIEIILSGKLKEVSSFCLANYFSGNYS
jgi:hypothetical protein